MSLLIGETITSIDGGKESISMPCGGIYPLEQHFAKDYVDEESECFFCGDSEPPVTHFCDEWDCYLHKHCIDEFLKTREGEIVLNHGHEVIR